MPNPFDQFDAPAAAANPFDQFDAKAKSVTAPTNQNDTAGGFLQKAMSAGTLGLSDWAGAGVNEIARATGYDPNAPTHAQILQQNAQYGQQHPLASLAADVSGYAGLSAITGGLGAEAAIGSGALTGTKALLARGALEGAIAGGGSNFINDPSNPMGALSGAAGGATLGAAGMGIGAGIGAGIGKLASLRAPKTVPDMNLGPITSSLQDARDAAYAQGNAIQFKPNTVSSAYTSGRQGLSLDQQANVSPGFDRLIQQHADLINTAPSISANNIDGFARGLDEAASSGSNADKVLAGRITQNLEGQNGVMGSATPISDHAPGDAFIWQRGAKSAHAAAQMAEGLQGASQGVADQGLNPAPWATKQINQFFPNASPNAPYAAQRQALLDIANAGGGYQTAYNVAHAAHPVVEGLGGMVGGWPGEIAAGVGYSLLAKPAIAKAMNAAQKTAYQNAIAKAYPLLTGRTPPQSLVGSTSLAPSASGTGNLIKNLMLGTAY